MVISFVLGWVCFGVVSSRLHAKFSVLFCESGSPLSSFSKSALVLVASHSLPRTTPLLSHCKAVRSARDGGDGASTPVRALSALTEALIGAILPSRLHQHRGVVVDNGLSEAVYQMVPPLFHTLQSAAFDRRSTLVRPRRPNDRCSD